MTMATPPVKRVIVQWQGIMSPPPTI